MINANVERTGLWTKQWTNRSCILMHKQALADSRVKHRRGMTHRSTLYYIRRNVLTSPDLESLICSSYIVNFALTFNFIDNRSTLITGQTIFYKQWKKNRLTPKNKTQPIRRKKPDLTQADSLLASIWLFLPIYSVNYMITTCITQTMRKTKFDGFLYIYISNKINISQTAEPLFLIYFWTLL